jgi:hypothetical protein
VKKIENKISELIDLNTVDKIFQNIAEIHEIEFEAKVRFSITR